MFDIWMDDSIICVNDALGHFPIYILADSNLICR